MTAKIHFGQCRELARQNGHLDFGGQLQFFFEFLFFDDLRLGGFQLIISGLELMIFLAQIGKGGIIAGAQAIAHHFGHGIGHVRLAMEQFVKVFAGHHPEMRFFAGAHAGRTLPAWDEHAHFAKIVTRAIGGQQFFIGRIEPHDDFQPAVDDNIEAIANFVFLKNHRAGFQG